MVAHVAHKSADHQQAHQEGHGAADEQDGQLPSGKAHAGEEEFEEADLKKGCAVCEYIEDEDSFNGKVIQKFLKKHRPDRIIIEYNGMWSAAKIPEFYDELEEICFDREEEGA